MNSARPPRRNARSAFAHGRRAVDPPSANQWDQADPSKRPVILVHGLAETMAVNWFALAPALADAGFAVFALDFGKHGFGFATHGRRPGAGLGGVGDITRCAEELDTFVERVLDLTGAQQVDLVGHSVGALVSQYYVKRLGGDTRVDNLVGLAPTFHGTTFNGLLRSRHIVRFASWLIGKNMVQQAADSDFLTDLYSDGDTVAGVEYTAIIPRWDIFTTPVSAQSLEGASATNIHLRGKVGHLGITFDRAAVDIVVKTLSEARAAATVVRSEGGDY